jgi:oligopeptide transport system substrate-binding protein
VRCFALLCCLAALAAADPDAWAERLLPPGDGWRAVAQNLVVNNESEPKSLDPHLMTSNIEARIALALFEGLTTLDPATLEPRPGLAASWESSPDGQAWTFHLRPGLTWSDGVPIDARTLRDSWLRCLDPATGAAYAELYDPIAGAEMYRTKRGGREAVAVAAADPLTLTVRLERPCPWFLSLTAFHAFAPVPLHAIAAHGDRWTRPEHSVVDGPFRLAAWQPRDRIVLTPNPAWHGRARLRLTSITLLPISDLDAAYRMFREGRLHWMPSIPQAKWEEVRWLPEYYVAPALNTYFYRFNCTQPPFDDKRVRRAFSLALDRRMIAGQVLRAGQIPATWFTPAVAGYEPPTGLATDRAEARRLLAEAGYGPGGKPLGAVPILYNTSEAHKAVAEAVAAQWEAELGVRCELVNREFKTYIADMDALNYTVARSGWIGDYLDPDTFLGLFRSGGGNNRTGWSCPPYDALLDQARRATDGRERLALYRQAEEILVADELPVLPLYIYVNQGLLRDQVHGWAENIRDEHPWQWMWIEP